MWLESQVADGEGGSFGGVGSWSSGLGGETRVDVVVVVGGMRNGRLYFRWLRRQFGAGGFCSSHCHGIRIEQSQKTKSRTPTYLDFSALALAASSSCLFMKSIHGRVRRHSWSSWSALNKAQLRFWE